MLIKPFIVFDPDERPGGGDPAPEAASAPEAVAPAQPGPGPWAGDFAEYFGENQEVRTAADRYMREKVQPHITELEQHPSRQLYADMLEDFEGTVAGLLGEVYDEDTQNAFVEWMAERVEGGEPPAEQPAAAAAEAQPQRSPEDQELLEWARQKRQQEQETAAQAEASEHYKTELARVKQLPGGETIIDELFYPFVAAADGDLDAALEGWKKYGGDLRAKFGIPEPEPKPAPHVLGGDGPPSGTPPTEKKYESLDDALDDTLAEMRARRQAPQTL